jgi:hypothetical protein
VEEEMMYPDTIELSITAADMAGAKRNTDVECPAWYAALRLFPGENISAGGLGILILEGREDETPHRAWYSATPALLDFIEEWDLGGHPVPQAFILRKRGT